MANHMNYSLSLVIPVILVMVVAYLLGSISFSIIITKICKLGDIRAHGSGNAGATNVLRTAGKLPAALTFILDFAKCAVAVILGRIIMEYVCFSIGAPMEIAGVGVYAAGLACLLGHIFPIYFGFRGGKGVVTAAAMIALIDWRVFLVLLAVFLIVFAIKKTVSLSSIIATALYPVFTFAVTFIFDYSQSPLSVHGNVSLNYLLFATTVSAIVGFIIVIKHKENIKRIIAGTEKPITFTRKG